MHWLWMGFYHGLAMLWETFWALVMGFGISAILQVFVSKEQMSRAFGRVGFREVALASALGAASSSCSYAAAAAGRSAFKKGAALVPAMAFMFASTNLVIELGAVIWLLMGWQFVVAETLGAVVLIGLMWMLFKFFFPKNLEEEARRHTDGAAVEGDCCHTDHDHGSVSDVEGKWSRVANAFVMDWMMLWKEIGAGFLIAGFLATLVPPAWWHSLFLQSGPAPVRLIENALIGPIIAVLSFVCSIGNIPLASLLWSNGISFGGVISFIYGDLIVIPLILIYAKYYGARAASYITVLFYVAMVVAGIVIDLLFNAVGLVPSGPRPVDAVAHAHISWNYTSWLDLAALLLAGWLVYLFLAQRKHVQH
jgi:uncharacterized membrane protein YraQ (UPF0718 family)